MIAFPGFRILEQLHDSDKSLVYRVLPGARSGAPLESEPASVILKVFRKPFPLPQDIARFKREYAVALRLDHAGIVRPLELSHYDAHWLLVMADLHGESLDKHLRSLTPVNGETAIPLDAFFTIALQLCDALEAIHLANVVHKDINPSNVIWNAQRELLQIIDFGISSELGRETPHIQSPDVLEGSLHYMAPEQTGRMNRVVDYRSDYYALGATFYELLSGRRLFQADDAMELVHCHLARTPDWSLPVFRLLPEQLIAVLQRLLEKNAEQRYQTIHGLRKDLVLCRALARAPGSGTVRTGLSDHSGVFHIPQKLYGREREIGELLAAFERVAGGHSEMLLVAGYSGIGKSAVVGEIHKPIVERRGYFVSGKFDQYKRNIPYASLIQAFQELIRQLLTEPHDKVSLWAGKLKDALGANARVIAALIPELHLIIGATEPVPELPPAESQNRLNRLFQRFVQVFSAAEHPLVVFLDDLQWADAPTLKLIELFMRDSRERYMFFIGAYRDNEVDAAHPLMAMRDTLQKGGVRLHTITLEALTPEHVTELVADTLRAPDASCRSLAALCYRKTQGNPFFLNQFLKSIHEAGYLTYDFNRDHWLWEMDALENAAFTDNVVELMIGKIRRLPPATQNLLQLAASIGNRFDLQTLALVSEQSPYVSQQQLWPALQADLIRPEDNRYKYLAEDEPAPEVVYRFLHDRVQQAAYAVVGDEEKQRRHLGIGRLLYRYTAEEAQQERLFAIVEQLNAGRKLIFDPAERLQLARLNHQAGLKARSSAAYQAALRHMRIGLSLLPPDAWQSCFALTLDLQLGAAEAAYLSGEFAAAEAIYPEVLAHCRAVLDKIRCYSVQVSQLQLQGRFLEAIAIQRQGLRLLEVFIPEDEAALQQLVAQGFAAVEAHTAGRSMESIMAAADMEGAKDLAAMQLLLGMWYASYLAGMPTLNAVTTMLMTQLSLKEGNCDLSSFAYVNYAFIVAALLQQYPVGYAFGSMAIELSNRRSNLSIRCSTHFLFATFTNHWNRPLRSSDPYYDDAYGWGLESGDFATVGYIVAVRSTDRVIQGKYLPDLLEACERDIALLQGTGQIDMVDCTRVGTVQSIKNLMGKTRSRETYDDDAFSENRFLADYANAPLHLAYFYHGKIRNAYLFDTAQAEALADKLPVVEQYVPGQCKIPEATFYAALTWVRALQRGSGRPDAPAIQEKFKLLQDRLAAWAAQCPDNFGAKSLLLQAEAARYRKDIASALQCYRQAIATARETGYVNLEALANALCGAFWLEQGENRVAEVFVKDALHLYRSWGADGVADCLQDRYALSQEFAVRPALHGVPSSTISTRSTGTTSTPIAALDLTSILKACHAISSEVGLRNVLHRLVEIVRENSGAQEARLLLLDGDAWYLEANVSGERAEVLQSQQVFLDAAESDLFPLSLLRLVVITGEEVVEEQLHASPSFGADPYVRSKRPQSVMCLPIKRAAQVTGIIYLENNLVTGSFTWERVEFLKVLVAQAIVSIDHARGHDNLERRVRERTAEADAARRRLVDMTDGLPLTVVQMREALDGVRSYVFVGKNVHEVLGVGAEEMLVDRAARWRNVLDEDRVANQVVVSHALDQRLPLEYQQRVRIDGRIRWIYTHAVPSKSPDGSWVWNGFYMDVTQSREQADDARLAKEVAENATRTKSAFLANMSHEIRTPMNAIIGLSHLALQTGLSAQQRDYIGKLHNAGKSLLGIVNDILDFSKIEAGKLDLDNIGFQLERMLDNVATVVGHKAAEKGLELVVEMRPDVPPAVIGDPLRLEQILINLIGNAIKFTERGEVAILVERLESAGAQAKLRFTVRDTGIGMTPLQQQRLFEAFTQADGSTTRKYGGTGLGLSICKRLVELMGGAIRLESEVDAGSAFSFTVWLGIGDSIVPRMLPPVLEGMRVLIADDNPAARRVLAGHCAHLPLIVDEAVNGEHAVAVLRQAVAAGRPFGLVLMDWEMPHLSGIEAARIIRSDSRLVPQPTLVLVTAFGKDNVRHEVEDIAVEGFMVKPVSASTLVDTLSAIYGGATHPQRPAEAARNRRLDGLRVLLVEDNPINQQIAGEVMAGAGIVVELAGNGRIAVEKIQAGGRYDAVLMDLQMPEMDGYAATAVIRADASCATLPILAMTAHVLAEERQHCLDVGMNDHIAKPIDPDFLLDTLARWDRRNGLHTTGALPVRPDKPAVPAADGWIDSESALHRMGGNIQLYHEVLAQFAADHAQDAAQIEVLLATDERAEAQARVHAIKGVAATIGASGLAELAGELERAIRTDQDDQALLARFVAASGATIDAIDGIVVKGK